MLSGLTRKQIYVDRNLAAILGVGEGELVSYADIQKRLHKYIKDNDLRNPQGKPQPSVAVSVPQEKPASQGQMKKCRDCGSDIPAEAVFCDLCGITQ